MSESFKAEDLRTEHLTKVILHFGLNTILEPEQALNMYIHSKPLKKESCRIEQKEE